MNVIADGFQAYLLGFQTGIAPDPDLWIDEWADGYMRIAKGNGAEYGKYHTARTPYARGVMRALSPGHPAKRVVVKAASQLMKTQVGLNWTGANIHQAPANMLVLLPTDKVAKRVSKRITKTIEEVPELRDRVAPPRSRDSSNTVDTKEFIGGTLYVTTAGSAANLAEVPIRYLYGDEIDRWQVNLDGEGSPIDLAENRATTYGRNAKFYYSSSPTESGASAIDDLFMQGNQQRYHVPCPHCGHKHVLVWENLRYEATVDANGTPAFHAWMICPGCQEAIEENSKTWMLDEANGAEWIAAAVGDGETVSFELSALYAPIGWISWAGMARQYAKAKLAMDLGNPELMQVFYNTRLAIVWDNISERIKADQIKAVVEDFPLRVVPAAALVLTAAVDTQGGSGRLECQVFGWAPGLERWTVDYHVIDGDPALASTWEDLDKYLAAPIQHASGRPMIIRAVAIDTGGHHTHEVYDYCKSRKRRYIDGQEQRIVAIKGASKPGRPIIGTRPSKVDINLRGRVEKYGAELWFIGTDTAKDWIHNRLLLTEGPGAIHYSKDLPDEYFDQLVAEHRKPRWVRGYKRVEWVKDKGARNEALDTSVYALAMAHYLELHKKPTDDIFWRRLRELYQPTTSDLFAPAVQPTLPVQTSAPIPPAPVQETHRATREQFHDDGDRFAAIPIANQSWM